MLFHKPTIRLRIIRFLILLILALNARFFITYISEKFILYLIIFFAFKSLFPPYYIEKYILIHFKDYNNGSDKKKYISAISIYAIFLIIEWIILYIIFR